MVNQGNNQSENSEEFYEDEEFEYIPRKRKPETEESSEISEEEYEEEDYGEDEYFDEDEEQEEENSPEAQAKEEARQKKRLIDAEKQLKNLNSINHEPNESLKRRRRRMKISKLVNRGKPKKKKVKEKPPALDFSSEYDPNSEPELLGGFMTLAEGGHAFLRSESRSFLSQEKDPVLPKEIVYKFALKSGLHVRGVVHQKKNKIQRVFTELQEINSMPAESWRPGPNFHSLTSVNPFEFFRLSTPQDPDRSMGLMELLTPIGKGQRGLIVAPPRTGKTILLEKIANGIAANHPEVEIYILLIDERPEEVTHLQRKVKAKVFASCLDKPIEEHISLSQMVIEAATRRVESGQDVVILLDSITRMSRAFNNQLKSSGRTLSGGVDAKALHEPKKFFGAARKLEEGGSLTIVATALIQTGSQMDEVIFQEFKGTGNMELVLNRRLAEKRIYPAIDIAMSGTRREELILPPDYYKAAGRLRRYLSSLTEANQMPAALQALEKYKTTQDFVSAFVS